MTRHTAQRRVAATTSVNDSGSEIIFSSRRAAGSASSVRVFIPVAYSSLHEPASSNKRQNHLQSGKSPTCKTELTGGTRCCVRAHCTSYAARLFFELSVNIIIPLYLRLTAHYKLFRRELKLDCVARLAGVRPRASLWIIKKWRPMLKRGSNSCGARSISIMAAAVSSVIIGGRGRTFYEWGVNLYVDNDPRGCVARIALSYNRLAKSCFEPT